MTHAGSRHQAGKVENGHPSRVAILGIGLESNRFAPVATMEDFRSYAYCVGDDILTDMTINYWIGSDETGGFVGKMNTLRSWQPVPILVADGQSAGPCDHEVYTDIKEHLLSILRQALPVDAVYIVAHGAGLTTKLDDLDGDYFQSVREAVGPDTPIVATLDLHGNLSDTMVDAVDVIIAQQTNPHTDSLQRAEDAAQFIHNMLSGKTYQASYVRVPLITPQVSQLTRPGSPYGEIMKAAQAWTGKGIASVSVLSGFSFSDTAYNGMTVYAVGGNPAVSEECTHTVAQMAWDMRHLFEPDLISVEHATQIASEAQLGAPDGPVIFADVADNPGGGGSGNTMDLLKSFTEAGVRNAYFGIIHDPDLVRKAAEIGIGGGFHACFNAQSTTQYSERFEADVEVMRVQPGDYKSRVGVYAGAVVPLGLSCLLRIGENFVIVTSIRQQLLGQDCFEHFGLDIRNATSLVVKSRGHFRAGFPGTVLPERIFEVDAPGLVPANLTRVDWTRLKRPIFPLDPHMTWQPNSS